MSVKNLDDELMVRMQSLGRTDVGAPDSESFKMMDTELRGMLAEAAVSRAGGAVLKKPTLMTSVVRGPTLQGFTDIFPHLTLVAAVMDNPIAGEIEVMRDLAVQTVMIRNYRVGRTIHVGGFQDQHVPYGRDVHCETDSTSLGVQAATHRRNSVLYSLYKEHATIASSLGEDSMSWHGLHDAVNACVCDSRTCSRSADFMLFDLLMTPMTQEQVCAAMLSHACEYAEMLLPVEHQSLGGTAGMIPLTSIRAVYDSVHDLIHYDASFGKPEFPSTPRALVLEHLQVACRWFAGYTFKFEVQETYGLFQRISVTCVQGEHPLSVMHSLWNCMDGDSVMVTVPRLRYYGADEEEDTSYHLASARVSRELFDNVYSYAMSLDKKQMSISLLREKINSVNDRVVIKGTTVELRAPLDPIVVDVVSLGVFACAFEDRYRATAGQQLGRSHITAVTDIGTEGFIPAAIRAVWTVVRRMSAVCASPLESTTHALIEQTLLTSTSASPVSVRDLVLHQDLTTVLSGNSYRHFVGVPLLNSFASGAGLFMAARKGLIDITDLAAMRWFSTTGAGAGDDNEDLEGSGSNSVNDDDEPLGRERLFPPAEGRDSCDNKLTDSLNSGALIQVESDLPDASEVLAEHQECASRLLTSHVDAGPDYGRDHRYKRFRTVVLGLDLAASHRTTNQVEMVDPILVLNENYLSVFPDVARADMSQDYEAFESTQADFAINTYYLRFPRDMQVATYGSQYSSRLIGPNRPNAKLSTRNMLSGMVKRNFDPNVIKIASDFDIATRVWRAAEAAIFRDDIHQHLLDLQSQPLEVSFPNFANWVRRAEPRKVDAVVKELLSNDTQLLDLPLDEFVAMFKGQVKPTLSAVAHRNFSKFQTIVYYENKVTNAVWSPIMQDVAARFESCLAPNVYVALRGDRKIREDHLSQYWPYGEQDVWYVQTDISEYDKSQGSETRALEDLVFTKLGMNDDMVAKWALGHRTTTIKCLALGIKAVVAYQRKSGDATTALGNVILNMLASAYVFGKPIVSISQGDDGLMLRRPGRSVSLDNIEEKYAQIFNLPVKVIVQKNTVTSIPYAMSCFYVASAEHRRVYVVPDPIRAIESLSKDLSVDEAKFDEKFVSFQDRVSLWKQPYDMTELTRMVRQWYERPDVDVGAVIRALISLGSTKGKFRSIWSEHTSIDVAERQGSSRENVD